MAYVKPNTSITFSQIPKRHIPDINMNNLEKKHKRLTETNKTTNEKKQEKISIPGL